MTSCSVLNEVTTNVYSDDSIIKFCHIASTRNNISSADFSHFCGNFPKIEAIELARSLEEIRTSIESIVTVFPDAKFFTGTGWFDDMLSRGEYSDEIKLIQHDVSIGEFTELAFTTWSLKNVKQQNNHTTHLHISLF